MLDENANNRVGHKKGRFFVLCAQGLAKSDDGSFDGCGVGHVGFDGRGDNRALGKILDAVSNMGSMAAEAHTGDTLGGNFNGEGRMRSGVHPLGQAANRVKLENALVK